MTKSLVSSPKSTQPAGGKGTSHQSTSTIQAHTLTTRMHFNFPPCCVQTQRAGNVAEGRRGSASDVVELLQKCETANVKRNTEVNVVATTTTTTTTAEPSNKPTAKCALPFPFPFSSPRGAARTRCRRQSSSICLPSIMAAHCGITALPDASCNEGVLPTADFGQLLIKRVENPLCYGI